MNSKHLFSTHPSFLLERLITQYKKQEQIVVAYDFDDTVRPMYCADCGHVQSLLRMLKEKANAYLIVFTSNEEIESVENYLFNWEIPYDSINQNAPFVPFKDGKIFYNILLDDKSGLGEVVNTLEQFLYLIENGYIKKEK